MSLAGTDFESYTDFQRQAENYRYSLAQRMNELQMQYISNKKPGPEDHPYTISSEHWKEMPDFVYQHIPIQKVAGEEKKTLVALLYWLVLLWLMVQLLSKKLKAI